MTTKTTPKGATAPQTPTSPTREEIQMAYQVHTLSQILYGHLATAQSWNLPLQAHGTHPHGGYPAQQVPQTPPFTWGVPFGWYR